MFKGKLIALNDYGERERKKERERERESKSDKDMY
jgi:hypothetical protein